MAGEMILIIEDNPLNLELAQDLLELAGYRVLSAPIAEMGIEIAMSEIPDLILMDIRLPGMNGLEAIRLLKQDNLTKRIPIVALTANAMPGEEEKALQGGSVGYITKPINTRQFASQVADYLSAGKA
jgi:CheY-like chemotaxis protein